MRRERIILLLSLGLNAALCIYLYNLRFDYRQLGVAFADESRDYGQTRRRLDELESSSRSRSTPQPALTITAYQHVLPSEAQSRLRSNKQLWRDIHRDGVVTHGLTIRELSEAIHA